MNNTPALLSDKDARLLNRILLDIAKELRVDRRFNGRINNLQLLDDRKRPDGTVCRKSETEWRDHPQIQLLLERRDRYLESRERLSQAVAFFELCRANVDPEDIPRCLSSLAKLETEVSAHLKAMESSFVAIRHETMTRIKLESDMLARTAQISEASRMHAERMDIERQKLGGDMNDVIGRIVSEEKGRDGEEA